MKFIKNFWLVGLSMAFALGAIALFVFLEFSSFGQGVLHTFWRDRKSVQLAKICMHVPLTDQDLKQIETLLKKGADPRQDDNLFPCPLLMKITSRKSRIFSKNDRKMIELLLQYGANPNATDQDDGYNALMTDQDIEVAKILLSHGAIASTKLHDGSGRSALTFAKERNQPEMVELLERAIEKERQK